MKQYQAQNKKTTVKFYLNFFFFPVSPRKGYEIEFTFFPQILLLYIHYLKPLNTIFLRYIEMIENPDSSCVSCFKLLELLHCFLTQDKMHSRNLLRLHILIHIQVQRHIKLQIENNY